MIFFAKKIFAAIICIRKPLSNLIESISISNPQIIVQKYIINDFKVLNYKYPHHFLSFFRKQRFFPERNVFLLNNIIFINKKGLALTAEKHILQESYGSVRKLFIWDDVMPFIHKKIISVNDENIYYYLPNKNFYHFLIEEVPSLFYAEKYFPNLLIAIDDNKKYPKYFTDFLHIIYGDEIDKKVIRVQNNILVKKGIITQRFPESGGILLDDIENLNTYFSDIIKIEETSNKNIYISRRRSKKRSIANEKEIQKLLNEYGFKTFYLEELDIVEQINIFANADLIISPHGAGLSHLIWNPRKIKTVLEIFPSYIRNDCFAGISVSLGYVYDYIICEINEHSVESVNIANFEIKLKEII